MTRGAAALVLLAILVVACSLPLLVSDYRTFQLTLALVYAIAILGLNILTGYNGQFSLGHGAFYAIGAYIAAIMMSQWEIPYYWALPVAGLICFGTGFLFGFPALRLEGLYLALATFALAVAAPQILKSGHLEPLTGGVQGIVVLKPDPPSGLPLSQDQWLYYFTLAVALALFVCAWNLVRGRSGRAIKAIRDNPIAAEAMGVDLALYKTLSFGVSAFYTGVAGALGAIVIQFVAPDSFTVFLSITLLVGVVVGGLASIPGAIFGGLFVQFVPNLAEQISKAAPWAIYGAFLIAFMYLMPYGVWGLLRALYRRLEGMRQRRSARQGSGKPPHPEASKMRSLSSLITATAIFGMIGSALAAGQYDPGASDSAIKIGHTNPYSGSASAYGAIGRAIGAYFDKINDEGGINGRKIEFITLDDGYSPPRTVEQIRKLVEQEQVLLVFQSLGTPTNTAIHQYMNAKKVPHLFVATGATKWGQPDKFPWTMGWQPNYQIEARIYARYILDNRPDARIGVLYQNDDYGKDYLKGFKAGLGDKADKMIVEELSYEVTDPTVDSQIISLKNSGADVFFNITTPKFAAQAIRKAADIGWQPLHLLNNVSNSVGSVLTPAGLDKSTGLITSLYQKDPTDPQWQDTQDYRDWSAWMDKYNPEADKSDQFNVYGYNAAMTLVHVLEQCGDNLTRENVMAQAANIQNLELPMLLPGVVIDTSTDDFFPIESMMLAKFDGEKWVLFGDVIDASQTM